MKVDSRGLPIDRGLKSTDKVDVKKTLLEVGKRISSEIVSVDGDEVVLKLGNSLIKARNASSEQLYSGMLADFEVLKSDKSFIEIRPVALSALSGEESNLAHLQKLARDLGVVDSGDNLLLLSKMMKLDYPVSKANFEELKLLFLQTARIADALLSELKPETPIFKEAPVLDSAKLLEVLSAGPKDIALKGELLNALSIIAAEGESAALTKPETGPIPEAGTQEVGLLQEEVRPSIGESKLNSIKEAGLELEVASQTKQNESSHPLPLKEGLDLAHMKQLVKEFKTLAADEGLFLNTLVSLSKQGLKPSMLNMVFANAMLKGEFGLAEAYFELDAEVGDGLEPQLKTALDQFKSKLLSMEAFEEVDADALEEMVRAYEELMNKIEEGAKSSRLPREAALISQHNQLSKDMQPLWQTIVLPLMTGNKPEDLEIYVKKDGGSKSGERSRSEKLVYLSLKTDHMDRLKIKIDYKPRSLKLHFFTKTKEVEQHIKGLIPKLEKALKSTSDKQLSIHVNSEEGNLNLIDFEIMRTKPSSKIDVRI